MTATAVATAATGRRSPPPTPSAGAPRGLARLADPALRAAAGTWLAVALLGQLSLATHVVTFYGGSAVQGDFERWNRILPHGFVAGDLAGNLVLSAHLAFAAIIFVCGALQVVPAVRRIAPRLHRWSGRVYMLAAATMGTTGAIMIWTRGGIGDLSQHVAITINAALILAFAGIAWRHAMKRRFDAHRRWALRLFLVVSGVWFFRIGLMFWLMVNQGPVGFDPKTFSGPVLTALAFGQYLVPLAVLQLYFHVKERGGISARFALAAGLALATLATIGGVFAEQAYTWSKHA